MLTDTLKKQIDLLPDAPGVYLMKDKGDKIIYIGKAKSLKKRVSQYFLRPQEGKVAAMVMHVDHFDFILVHSDKEAFILEMNLIQTHYPRYNILLMDDSHYPYIALKKHRDPLLKIARNSADLNYFYFGPFPGASHVYEVIDLLNKIYPTRKCRRLPNKPCLYYSLGQCLAPCIQKIDDAVADKLYQDIKRFLNGDTGEAKALLKQKMADSIDKLEFERAAEYKKTLDAIEYITAKQTVEIATDKTSRDIIGFASRDNYLAISILTYRQGMLLGKKVHVVSSFLETSEQCIDLLSQYYNNHETPKEIVSRIYGLEEEFQEVFPEIKVIYPQEGRLVDMLSLATLNAQQGLDAHFMSARLSEDNLSLLEELGKTLQIPTPLRIELFDNSHLQGSSPVGAMVCYINGEPCKKMYRKYHLDEADAGDDYHSMKEVVYRRYSRIKEEGGSFPDLLLADGGLPQVHACLEGFEQAGVSIPVFGLYKNDKHQTEGLIDKDGNTYPLDSKSRLFFLLMRMQDEVHRFAISFHIQQRSKKMTNSIFDDIAGIGEKRKEALRRHYPNIDELMKASIEELSQVIPETSARSLYKKLHEKTK